MLLKGWGTPWQVLGGDSQVARVSCRLPSLRGREGPILAGSGVSGLNWQLAAKVGPRRLGRVDIEVCTCSGAAGSDGQVWLLW